jgi:probable rRNA maturation factor
VSDINIYFEETDVFDFQWNNLKSHIRELIEEEQKICGEISIILCSDEYLLKMNREYLNHDYYTDIVTFNYVEKNIISGDLFISIERVRENAAIYSAGFDEELYRIVSHGILHLSGYNDITEEEKALIRKKENYYLKKRDFRGEGNDNKV